MTAFPAVPVREPARLVRLQRVSPITKSTLKSALSVVLALLAARFRLLQLLDEGPLVGSSERGLILATAPQEPSPQDEGDWSGAVYDRGMITGDYYVEKNVWRFGSR